MHPGKTEKIKLALDILLDLLAPILVDRIPLVHRHHQGTAGLDGKTCDMRVLVGDILTRIDHQHHHVAFLNGLQRLDYRKLLDGLEHFAASAQTRRIHQDVFPTIAGKRHLDGIPRGAWHVEGDDALLAEQGIDEGALANVGPASYRDARPRRG